MKVLDGFGEIVFSVFSQFRSAQTSRHIAPHQSLLGCIQDTSSPSAGPGVGSVAGKSLDLQVVLTNGLVDQQSVCLSGGHGTTVVAELVELVLILSVLFLCVDRV